MRYDASSPGCWTRRRPTGYLHEVAAQYAAADFLAEQDKIRIELESRLRHALSPWGVEAVHTSLGEFELEEAELDEIRRTIAAEHYRGRLLHEKVVNAHSQADLEAIGLATEHERRRLHVVELEEQIRLLGRDTVAMERMLAELAKMNVPEVIVGNSDDMLKQLPLSVAHDTVTRLAKATAAVSASVLGALPGISYAAVREDTPAHGRIGPALARELAAVRVARGEGEAGELGDQVIAIYLGDDGARTEVQEAVVELTEAAGWAIAEWSEEIQGSWFKLLKAKAKDVAASDLAHEVAADLRRAAELRTLHVTQAQVDDTQATAASRLIQSLENTQRAVLLVGSILVVKVDGAVTVRTLSHRHLDHLERHPHLIADPTKILLALPDDTAGPDGRPSLEGPLHS